MNIQKEIGNQNDHKQKTRKTFWEALMKSDELNLSKINSGRNRFVKSLIKNANKYCKIIVYNVKVIFHVFFFFEYRVVIQRKNH